MTLPIMSATGRLTEEQQRLVEQHIHAADQAANWMVKPYQSRGMTYDDARSDALAWLVLSALKFEPKKEFKFLTYYLSNIKWWRSDIITGRARAARIAMRTMQLSQLAHKDTHDERNTGIEVVDRGVEPIDAMIAVEQKAWAQARAITLISMHCRRVEIMLDRVAGMSTRAIAKKHRLSHQRISQILSNEKRALRSVFKQEDE